MDGTDGSYRIDGTHRTHRSDGAARIHWLDGSDGSFGVHGTHRTHGSDWSNCILSVLLTHVMHGALYGYIKYTFTISVWVL
jgi:hypothetical protein